MFIIMKKVNRKKEKETETRERERQKEKLRSACIWRAKMHVIETTKPLAI